MINNKRNINFKILRIKKNLTQKELAEKVGVTSRSIQYYESGRILPSLIVAKKIADEFQQPIEAIFFTN